MASSVNLTQFVLMQDLTDQLVQEFGFPTNATRRVNMYAQQICGLRCVMSNTKSHFSAKDKTIYVNENFSPREFILYVAKQIGHWLLHQVVEAPDWDRSQSNLKQLQKILGSVKTKNKKKKSILQAKEAEQFASALLIPRILLLKQSKIYEKIDAVAADDLAVAFDVPRSLMVYRLQQLMDHWLWKEVVIDSVSLENREITLRDSGTVSSKNLSQQNMKTEHGENVLPGQDTFGVVQMSLLDVLAEA